MTMRFHQIGAFSPRSIPPDSDNVKPKPNPRVSVQKKPLETNSPSSSSSSSMSLRCGFKRDPSTARQTLTEWKYRSGGVGGPERDGVPVYVMLPLDSVTATNGVNRRKAMNACFQALKTAGVEGVMVGVGAPAGADLGTRNLEPTGKIFWIRHWLVEREAAGEYNWNRYTDLFEMAKRYGLKVQAVMSFHQCGGNVGDSCTIPLPKWVVKEINKDPDLAYTDQWGRRNYEYVSLGCDTIPCLKGRTPIQCYTDYMRAFSNRFSHLFGDTIVVSTMNPSYVADCTFWLCSVVNWHGLQEIQVGMGPAGELRYPSYPEKDGIWKFPGIGAFQCYDKYMLCCLKAAAEAYGKPEWGTTGPTDAGEYNNSPEETNFFKKECGGWNWKYGKFFLSWYSQMLLDHGERILTSATSIFNKRGVKISVKVAGIHWHYGTRSHASELTAGYYNTRFLDGYVPIAKMLSRFGAVLNFTCVEMRNHEQPWDAHCLPENLVRQVAVATQEARVLIAGENALPRYDDFAHEQILWAAGNEERCAFTYLRLNRELFEVEKWRKFVKKMKEGKDVGRCWNQVEKEAELFVKVTEPLVQEAAVALML